MSRGPLLKKCPKACRRGGMAMSDAIFSNPNLDGHSGAALLRTEQSHLNSRVGSLDEIVLRDVLDRQARERPNNDLRFLKMAPAGLIVEPGNFPYGRPCFEERSAFSTATRSLSWLANRQDALRVWFGLNCLGAIVVPINIAYRGRLLEHVVQNAQAKHCCRSCRAADRLNDINRAALTTAIVVGGAATPQNLEVLSAGALDNDEVAASKGCCRPTFVCAR
jgi:carnitine-CoA ligase